ncbi:MAG: hypothetical protein PWQ79_21 [Thermococcaceae archaeon]|nr:hypothetical protein [Thermococcaceae archaeon]
MSRAHAILAVFLWSTVAAVFKLTLRQLSPLQLLFYASLTSLSVLSVLYLRRFSVRRENLSSAYLGFLNPFLYYTVLFSAYERLPAQEAQALNYTWPLMLVILSIPLLGTRPGVRTFIGLIMGFFGAVIVATRGSVTSLNFTDTLGVGLAFSSAVIWATYWLLNVKDGRESVEKMFWNFLFGFVYVSIAMALTGDFSIPSPPALVGAVYAGLFEMGITFLLWHRALESDLSFASNLAYLVPFLSLLFISIVVGEKIEASTVLGLAFIVTGIVVGRGGQSL